MRKKRIIWSNINLDIDNWDFDEDEQLTVDQKYDRMYDDNNLFFEDERRNLDVEIDNRIIVIADLGFWDGRRTGYKILDNNINSILSTYADYAEWYGDGYNIKATAHHHDGTNYYLYRELREDRNYQTLLDKLYYGKPVSSSVLNYYTKSIYKPVAKVYGW